MTTADIEPTNGSESNDDNINDDNNNNGSESEFEFESEPDDELYDLWPYDKEKVREWVIGCRVANDFDSQGVFHGKVVRVFNVEENSIKNALFQIKFDDGDSEDFNAIELYGTCHDACRSFIVSIVTHCAILR